MEGAMSTHPTETIAHPGRDELELGAILHALSDPVRLRIVAELARAESEYTCESEPVLARTTPTAGVLRKRSASEPSIPATGSVSA